MHTWASYGHAEVFQIRGLLFAAGDVNTLIEAFQGDSSTLPEALLCYIKFQFDVTSTVTNQLAELWFNQASHASPL